eukprot:NODE_7021_length_1617_cov_3.733557.p1 GENE.NODE_7021_length_1617_cov_3.733557~~NODE_7021_length_1617_cov_3.733557.p1  ORF type:complete len:381 (-),score=117.81 NODE_7021_length_1617_cov_3.733557:322-1464(-)
MRRERTNHLDAMRTMRTDREALCRELTDARSQNESLRQSYARELQVVNGSHTTVGTAAAAPMLPVNGHSGCSWAAARRLPAVWSGSSVDCGPPNGRLSLGAADGRSLGAPVRSCSSLPPPSMQGIYKFVSPTGTQLLPDGHRMPSSGSSSEGPWPPPPDGGGGSGGGAASCGAGGGAGDDAAALPRASLGLMARPGAARNHQAPQLAVAVASARSSSGAAPHSLQALASPVKGAPEPALLTASARGVTGNARGARSLQAPLLPQHTMATAPARGIGGAATPSAPLHAAALSPRAHVQSLQAPLPQYNRAATPLARGGGAGTDAGAQPAAPFWPQDLLSSRRSLPSMSGTLSRSSVPQLRSSRSSCSVRQAGGEVGEQDTF